jgi:hypothetical protein
MSVYVDDWRQLATIRTTTSRWSHLTADTTEELHLFARRLGIPARAFQQKPGKPQFDHYDVPEELRIQAIALGAVAVTWREAAKLRRRGRSTATATATTSGLGGASAPGPAAGDHHLPG